MWIRACMVVTHSVISRWTKALQCKLFLRYMRVVCAIVVERMSRTCFTRAGSISGPDEFTLQIRIARRLPRRSSFG